MSTDEIRILEGFGMSEIGLVVYDAIDYRKTGSCGRVLDDLFEVKLFDDNDMEVPIGGTGEIVVRPKKPYIMMTEYYNERMAYFAILRYIEIVSELPKTPTNLIEKYQLSEAGITEQTRDREEAWVKIKRYQIGLHFFLLTKRQQRFN